MSTNDRRTRAGKLFAIGRDAYEKEPDKALGLIRAFAAIAAESGKRNPKQKEEVQRAPLPFTPRELYELVRDSCPNVACVPVSRNWFGLLGTKMQNTGSLQRSDMQLMVDWINGGGLSWMEGVADFGMIVRKFPEWMARARLWGMEQGRTVDDIEEAMK